MSVTRFRAVSKLLIKIFLTLTLAGVISTISAVLQHQAANAWAPFGLDKICDVQYNMDAPGVPDSADSPGHKVDGTNVLPNSSKYTDLSDFWAPYGNSGYEWPLYEISPCAPQDAIPRIAANGVANGAFGWITAFAGVMRAYITIPFSSDVISPFLSSQIVKNIYKTFDERLIQAGMLTMLTGLGGLWLLFMFHKNGAKLTLGRMVWALVSAGLAAALIATNVTRNLYTTINGAATQISLVPAAAVSGSCGGKEADAKAAVDCISGALATKMINPVYMYGAMGNNMGDAKAQFITSAGGQPEEVGPGSEVIYNKKSNNYISDKKYLWFDAGGQGDAVKFKLPAAGVVPTVNSDKPTWAEYLRWTSSYTKAEQEAVNAGEVQACAFTSMPPLDKLHEQAEKNPDLCTKKWQVRAALFYAAANGTGGYPTMAGKTPAADRLPAALTTLWANSPAINGISFLGLHRMILNLDLIFLALTLWFRFALMAGTANPAGVRLIIGDHAIWGVKVVGLGLVLAGTVLTQAIVYNTFVDNPMLRGMNLSTRGNVTSMLTFLGLIVSYIMYFRGMRKLVQRSKMLARAQVSSIGGRLKAGSVKALSTGAAAAGAAMTGGATAALVAAGSQVAKEFTKNPNSDLDNVKDAFSTHKARASQKQRERQWQQREEARRANALTQAGAKENYMLEALDEAQGHSNELGTLYSKRGQAEKQYLDDHQSLNTEAKAHHDAANAAQRKTQRLQKDMPKFERDVERGSNLLVGTQEVLRDVNGQTVKGANGQDMTVADVLGQTEQEIRQLENEQHRAQKALDDYLTETNRSVMHTMNLDSEGKPVDATVIDLSTGSETRIPLSEYDADLSMHNVFSTPEDLATYTSLRNTLEATNSNISTANSEYSEFAERIREKTDAFKTQMYDPRMDTATIAATHNLPQEQVAQLRVKFQEHAQARHDLSAARYDRTTETRLAAQAAEQIKKRDAAYRTQLANLDEQIKSKQQDLNNATRRAETIATEIDTNYTTAQQDNRMAAFTPQNPYIVNAQHGQIHLEGKTFSEAAAKVAERIRTVQPNTTIETEEPPKPLT